MKIKLLKIKAIAFEKKNNRPREKVCIAFTKLIRRTPGQVDSVPQVSALDRFYCIVQSTPGISNITLFRTKVSKTWKYNTSLFISLLKLVNFNNIFGLLLNFFLCQDTSAKMFLSIRQNLVFAWFTKLNSRQNLIFSWSAKLKYVTFAIRQNFFP